MVSMHIRVRTRTHVHNRAGFSRSDRAPPHPPPLERRARQFTLPSFSDSTLGLAMIANINQTRAWALTVIQTVGFAAVDPERSQVVMVAPRWHSRLETPEITTVGCVSRPSGSPAPLPACKLRTSSSPCQSILVAVVWSPAGTRAAENADRAKLHSLQDLDLPPPAIPPTDNECKRLEAEVQALVGVCPGSEGAIRNSKQFADYWWTINDAVE